MQGIINAPAAFETAEQSARASDTDLFGRIATKELAAFEQIYDRYANVLYSTALRVLDNPDQAVQVLEDVFGQIWDRAAHWPNHHSSPWSWMLALALQSIHERVRVSAKTFSFEHEILAEMRHTASRQQGLTDALSEDHARLVRDGVDAIALEDRQVIEMAFFGGMTEREIANALHQPEATVRHRFHRGMTQLRQNVGKAL